MVKKEGTNKKIKKVVVNDVKLKPSENKPDIYQRKQEVYRRIRFASRSKQRRKKEDEDEGLDVRIVSIRRVAKTRVGSKRLRLSVMVVIGDKKGKIGVGIAKGVDVKIAQKKAVSKAKKRMFSVKLKGQTIPHSVISKFHAAKVFLKPAAPGTGVIAGGPVRAVVEVAGIKDILSKEIGSKNPISNVYATYNALINLKLERFE